MIVRGCHFSFATEEGAALATLYYPGDDSRLAEARLTGQVPALETDAPWPLVVMMPGINVAADGYRWLAHRLVTDGLCVVTYAVIGSLGPAGRGITPGMDLAALGPEKIGTRPSSTVLGPLLGCLHTKPSPSTQVASTQHTKDGSLDTASLPTPRASTLDSTERLVDTSTQHTKDGSLDTASLPTQKAPVLDSTEGLVDTSTRHANDGSLDTASLPTPRASTLDSTERLVDTSTRHANDGIMDAKSSKKEGVSALDGTPVDGLVDLDQVVLGGHSAGGTMALHNSNPAWVPGLRAVFSYGGHTMTASGHGHPTGTVIPIPAGVPVMLLAGTDDGVISASRDRYGRCGDDVHDPIRRTFAEAVGRNRDDSWLIELSNAGHFAICWPVDTTSGRTYLESGNPAASQQVRALLGDLIAAFIASALGRSDTTDLERLATHQAVNHRERR